MRGAPAAPALGVAALPAAPAPPVEGAGEPAVRVAPRPAVGPVRSPGDAVTGSLARAPAIPGAPAPLGPDATASSSSGVDVSAPLQPAATNQTTHKDDKRRDRAASMETSAASMPLAHRPLAKCSTFNNRNARRLLVMRTEPHRQRYGRAAPGRRASRPVHEACGRFALSHREMARKRERGAQRWLDHPGDARQSERGTPHQGSAPVYGAAAARCAGRRGEHPRTSGVRGSRSHAEHSRVVAQHARSVPAICAAVHECQRDGFGCRQLFQSGARTGLDRE